GGQSHGIPPANDAGDRLGLSRRLEDNAHSRVRGEEVDRKSLKTVSSWAIVHNPTRMAGASARPGTCWYKIVHALLPASPWLVEDVILLSRQGGARWSVGGAA